MATIAFAWELGGELGHAMACATLGEALARRGHGTAYVLRELRALDVLPHLRSRQVLQAPVFAREGMGVGAPDSWADILLGCGYDDAGALSTLVEGWLQLLRKIRPDLLIADDAPTALLAARILGIPRVNYSNGWAIPPRAVPLPSFRIDARVDRAKLVGADARALDRVNTVLERHGLAPLAALHEQQDTSEDFLCTFPELDHYGSRPAARYWGPRYTLDAGDEVAWPYGDGPRVLVYLRPTLGCLDALIDALVAERCRVVAYIPGLQDARASRLKSAQRRIVARPVRLGSLLRECDLFLNHGGNVGPGALMEGVAQWLFPAHYEQLLTALRIERLGAGRIFGAERNATEVRRSLARMVADVPRMRVAAQAYRRRYASFSQAEQERRVVARIEEILSKGAA